MKPLRRIFLVIAILSMVSLACSLSEALGSQGSGVLFQDDFSSPNSGWETLRDGNEIIDYENGGLRILINQVDYDYWSVNELGLSDVHIEVDVTKVAGPDDNDFGIICRYEDENKFYGFLISSDGYYGISKMVDTEHNIIGLDGMQFSDKIRTGTATNRVGADCVGSRLALYVNGEKLAEVEDADYQSGAIGLLAGTFTEPGVDVLFDNLVVTSP